MGLSQGTYLRLLGLTFLFIAFGSCFSFGYSYQKLNPGDWVVKLCFIFLYFLGFWFFFNKGKEIQKDEASLPTINEANKIVEEFQASVKKKSKR